MNSAQPHLFWHRLIAILLLLALLSGMISACGGTTASAASVEKAAETSAQFSTQLVTQPLAVAPAQRAAPTATSMSPTSTPLPAVEVAIAAPNEKPLLSTTNILLLGSDRRPDMPNWRTDVMMIVAVDPVANRVGVISLPRDLYIDVIPNHRGNKINVIDYLGEQDEPNGGGPQLLGQVLEDKIGIPIHHYVRVDFESVKKLVDAIGGVEIDVDCPLYDPYGYDEGGSPLALDVGVYRLDGGEALSYVRSRRIGGDLERERRQQRFIWAVRTQIRNENLLQRVPAIYQAMQGSVQTDLNLIDAVKLVRMAMNLEKDHVHGFVVNDPSMITAGYAGQMWVWYANWPEIAKAAQDVFNRPALFNESEDGQVQCP